MGLRGRSSVAELMNLPVVKVMERPSPPEDLSEEEALEWTKIVNCMDADYFLTSQLPMLAQLCRHIVEARVVAEAIRACRRRYKDEDRRIDYRDLGQLLSIQRAESDNILKLSRSLRLTHQSITPRNSTKMRHRKDQTHKPWDDE